MPVNLTNIGEITPATSPLEVNGSLDLTGTGVGYYVNGSALITGLGVQHGAAAVGTQPAINLIDTTSLTWTVTNNAANNRVDISGVSTGAGYLADVTTTLGDLIVRGTTAIQRLPVGTNGQVLRADSTATGLGVRWETLDAANIDLNPPGATWITIQDAVEGLEADSPGSILTAQGDLLTRSATALARLAHGTSGQVLTVDTAQPNAIHWATPAASPASILTTLGDILVRSATAPARLGVGTNGQVLRANSATTLGVDWETLDATDIDLNPQVGSWTTVQAAVAGLNTASPTSVLTTLGDLLVRGTAAPVRLGVGTNDQVLTADSTAPNGVRWATPPNSPEDILTTKGDLLGFTTEPARVPVGTTNDQALLVDASTASGVAWKALIASMVGVSPAIGSWTTVQNALSSISTTLTTLSRGMAYVGFYNAATDHADFVPPLNTLDGPLPAANATGLEEGDYLVVTVAGTHPTLGALHVGDQLISTGTATWTVLPIGTNMASVTAATVPLSPDINSWGNVQAAITSLNTRAQAAGTVGQVQFNNGGTPPAFGASANLFWDTTNSRLGVGTSVPTTPLDVFGSGYLIRAQGTANFAAIVINHASASGGQSDISFQSAAHEMAIIEYDADEDNLIFWTGGNDAAMSTLCCNTDSYVGVRQTSPQWTLDVGGDTNIGGATTGNGRAYRINGIPIAAINANGTTVNLTNINSINGASPGGTPAGATGQLQFNGGGTPASFAASAFLTFDSATSKLNLSSGASGSPGIHITEPTNPHGLDVYVNSVGAQIIGAANTALYMVSPTQIEMTAPFIYIDGTSQTPATAPCIQLETPTNANGLVVLANGNVGIGKLPGAFRLAVAGDLDITGDFSINGVVFAEAGSAHLKATSLRGLDGEPLKLVLSDGRELDLDAVIDRLEKLEALLA